MEGETQCSGSRLSDNVTTACIFVVTEWKWVPLKKKKKKYIFFFFFFFRETPTSPWVSFRAKFRPLGRLFRPSRPPYLGPWPWVKPPDSQPRETTPGQARIQKVSLAGRWWPNIECWLGSFVIFQGVRTSIAKKPYIFVIFQGGQDPLSPHLDLHMLGIRCGIHYVCS